MAFMTRLEPIAQQPREIFLLVGASNMDGRGVANQLPAFPYQSKVKVYNMAGSWVDAAEPIAVETGATYSVLTEGTVGAGPGLVFANALYQYRPFREIGLVPCARGGTALSEMQRNLSTSTIYGATMARAAAAVASSGGGSIKGILIQQGGSEADDSGLANNWAANFLTLYDDWCDDLEIPDLKCIVTGNGPNPDDPDLPHWDTVIAQQESLDGARDGNIAYVPSEDVSVYPDDNRHWNTSGCITVGLRYAEAMAALLA